MGLFDSIFGIDITGNGKADMLDDLVMETVKNIYDFRR